MKKIKLKLFTTIVIIIFLLSQPSYGCTIVSVIDKNGQVWNLNNEDGPYGVANFLNVFPKTENTKYGYFTLSYFSPALGNGGGIQGGMNEAGLTFDFNAIDPIKEFDPSTKKTFPSGDNAILPHILATMSTVDEVVNFFSIYWFQNGFTGAQMHVADKSGTFALISPSGIKIAEKGQPLISTNFDICGNESGASCWRYPIAQSKIESEEINLLTLMDIALATRQKNGSTMYTNIQNLSTGDLWFFSKHDPNFIVPVNIGYLLEKGQKSYTFNDLNSFIEPRSNYTWQKPTFQSISEETKNKFVGTYNNFFAGDVVIRSQKEGLEASFADGNKAVFQPISENEFALMEADVKIKFILDKSANLIALDLYDQGYWSFRAWIKP